MLRKIFLSTLSIACVLGASNLSAAQAATTAAPALLRDHQAARFDLTPPAPTQAHPEVIQPDTQIEPSIAVNPANDQQVVAAYQEGRVAGGGDMTNGWATSRDGGQTWVHGEFPCLTYTTLTPSCPAVGPYDRASDAVVAWGPNNTVYGNHLVFNDETTDATGMPFRSAIAVNVSHDGGLTWGPPVVFQDDNLGGLNDKNWIVVDNSTAPGHHYGRVYVVWYREAPVVYNYCDANCDQRSNWLPNFLPVYPGQGISSIPLVLPNGSLAVVFQTNASLPLYSPPTDQPIAGPGTGIDIVLAPIAGTLPAPIPVQVPRTVAQDQGQAIREQRASDGTIVDADVDQKTGQIYVVWADGGMRGGGVNDAVITTSTDGGLTWSPPARMNPGTAGDYINHYNVTVAVGSDSSVRVAYRQRQEAATTAGFSPNIDTFYQQSNDAGKTWTSPLRVNTVRTNAFYGAFSRNGLFEGDYNEIAAGGAYSYIVRAEALPQTANEPHGLVEANGILTGNPAGCGESGLRPACLTHLHQRTWVAVVKAATVSAPASPVAVSGAGATPSALASILPDTAAAVGRPLSGWVAGMLLLVVSVPLGVRVSGRRRRARSRR